MALPLGKLTILIGAGLVGSVLAKEGSLPDVSHFVSGAFKIVLRQLKQDEPAKSGSRPRNDTLTAQVNSLRHELQLLASNRPITIISTGGSGGKKYGWIIIIGVIGYGYVWWKGWKLPDFMFATRRSLSDACNNVGSQIDGFYESLSGTKRELGSEIDRMDRSLDESTIIIKETGREVNELRDGTANMKDDVRSVFEAVETLASKVYRIEGNQDLTLKGSPIKHEPSSALPSTSSVPALEPAPVTPSLRSLSLPPASPRESQLPSTPNGAQQSNGPLQHTQSMSGLKDINESSNGTSSGEAIGNTSSGLFSMFSMPRIGRTRSAVNAVPANLTGAQ
ncbi:BnaA08g31120D [Brassica napus]|uniref:BnaA08g31120D protein n=1 Tax=Brassica napus TaxID=3708 RepID=A0A078JKA8_BRANA|nr:BnaA08g31120D [Brassica napus]